MLNHHLRVTLTAITGRVNLHNNQIWNDVPRTLVETRVDLAHVVLPCTLTRRDEAERLWLKVGISAKNVQNNARRRTVITRTENVAVTDDESELPFIVILELRERIDSPA